MAEDTEVAVAPEAAIELLQMQIEAQARQFSDLQERALAAFGSAAERLRALEAAKIREVLLLAALGEQQATSRELLQILVRTNGDLRSTGHRVAALEGLVATMWRSLAAERSEAFLREVDVLASALEADPAYRDQPEVRSIVELFVSGARGELPQRVN